MADCSRTATLSAARFARGRGSRAGRRDDPHGPAPSAREERASRPDRSASPSSTERFASKRRSTRWNIKPLGPRTTGPGTLAQRRQAQAARQAGRRQAQAARQGGVRRLPQGLDWHAGVAAPRGGRARQGDAPPTAAGREPKVREGELFVRPPGSGVVAAHRRRRAAPRGGAAPLQDVRGAQGRAAAPRARRGGDERDGAAGGPVGRRRAEHEPRRREGARGGGLTDGML
mmetsp:Transcript_17344/g.43189  ORF Transcript_17344/g.43189 Transcript_17344/m.43189 type:complete len:230 (-) Transcript_17344:69-758(-)